MNNLKEAVEILSRDGLPVTWEYPGYIRVFLRDGHTADFGFANGPLGYDINTDDGDSISSGDSELPEDSAAEVVVEYVKATLRAHARPLAQE